MFYMAGNIGTIAIPICCHHEAKTYLQNQDWGAFDKCNIKDLVNMIID